MKNKLLELKAILMKQLECLKRAKIKEVIPLNRKCNEILMYISNIMAEKTAQEEAKENRELLIEIRKLLGFNQALLKSTISTSVTLQKLLMAQIEEERGDYTGVFLSEAG